MHQSFKLTSQIRKCSTARKNKVKFNFPYFLITAYRSFVLILRDLTLLDSEH